MESVTASWDSDLSIAARLKKELPHCTICLVGTHVTSLWQETLEREGAQILTLRIVRPSMEDVFMHLAKDQDAPDGGSINDH